jgi:DNA-binding IclR family transcriptional regulator
MKNKPAYAIESVDSALRLALLLQQEGPLRGSEVADRLGVARSTAHRLLAMLVYRDFAEQDQDQRYAPGPVLRTALLPPSPVSTLRRVALPYLHDLMDRAGETVNLQVLVGSRIRFVATVECAQVLRVGDREGKILPAHLVSGGKMLLATLGDEEIRTLYSANAGIDVQTLLAQLHRIRQRGFAINDQKTERGVTALARPVLGADGHPMAAVALAMPSARFSRGRLPEWIGDLGATAAQIERALAAAASADRRSSDLGLRVDVDNIAEVLDRLDER